MILAAEAGYLFFYKSLSPLPKNMPTNNAAGSLQNPLPPAFTPGIKKLAEFLKTNSIFIADTSFTLVVSGKVKSIEKNQLTLTLNGKELQLTDEEDKTKRSITFLEADEKNNQPLKTIAAADIRPGDEVEVNTTIKPSSGKLFINFVTKIIK